MGVEQLDPEGQPVHQRLPGQQLRRAMPDLLPGDGGFAHTGDLTQLRLQRGDQQVDIDGLGQIIVCPRQLARDHIGALAELRNDDDRHIRQIGPVAADLLQQDHAVMAGQGQIAQHRIGDIVLQQRQRIGVILHRGDAEPMPG